MAMTLNWFCRPVIVKEWQPFIATAIRAEDFHALSLLFQALADEDHAHHCWEIAWDNRADQDSREQFATALQYLEQARVAWFSLTVWTQDSLRRHQTPEGEAAEYSSRKHAQRLYHVCQDAKQLCMHAA